MANQFFGDAEAPTPNPSLFAHKENYSLTFTFTPSLHNPVTLYTSLSLKLQKRPTIIKNVRVAL
jgi:hypothetical protein